MPKRLTLEDNAFATLTQLKNKYESLNNGQSLTWDSFLEKVAEDITAKRGMHETTSEFSGETTGKDVPKQGINQQDLNQLSELVTAVMPLAKQYVDLQKTKFDFTVKRDERAGSHSRKLTLSLLVFLGFVIGIMAILTFLGKVSGDALLFMVGIVVGYLMNMIQGLLYSPWDNDETES